MGLTHAEIELVSMGDLELLRRGYIRPKEVRLVKVKALVDSGAYMMCINEHIKRQLDLPVKYIQEVELANGKLEEREVVGPLELRFGNRMTSCNALVFPGESEVLLGAIPMEDLDVVLDLKEQKMMVNPANPYMPKKKIK